MILQAEFAQGHAIGAEGICFDGIAANCQEIAMDGTHNVRPGHHHPVSAIDEIFAAPVSVG